MITPLLESPRRRGPRGPPRWRAVSDPAAVVSHPGLHVIGSFFRTSRTSQIMTRTACFFTAVLTQDRGPHFSRNRVGLAEATPKLPWAGSRQPYSSNHEGPHEISRIRKSEIYKKILGLKMRGPMESLIGSFNFSSTNPLIYLDFQMSSIWSLALYA